MSENTYENDIAFSSRVRIARNVKNMPFPCSAGEEDSETVNGQIMGALKEGQAKLKEQLLYYGVREMPEDQRVALVEGHLISPNLGNNYDAGALISEDRKVSVMINEEDHIRIQAFADGFRLKDAYDMANRIDDVIEDKVEYAFSEKYGYLTSCPTNLGSGLRGSVMLHLPALMLADQMNVLVNTANKYGLTIRGIYGEGNKALGDLFQVSNQNSLGLSEEEILDNLHAVSKEIIKRERSLRSQLLENDEYSLKDRVSRAYGILANAYEITTKESMQLLSLMRLGIDLKIVEGVDSWLVVELMSAIQPATLRLKAGKELTQKERDRVRAEQLRNALYR